jgi:hypothetical protein
VALLSDLVKAVAAVEGLDRVTVEFYARSAREARLISQKGRGRGAAHMTLTDAANLLIGINASALARDVADVIPRFRALKLDWTDARHLKIRALRDIVASRQSFGEHLESLLELARPDRTGESALSKLLSQSIRKSDLAFADKEKLTLPAPGLQLEFVRTSPVASIRLLVPRVLDRRQRHLDLVTVAGAVYRHSPYRVEAPRPERREVIMVTDRTLTEVSRCIFNSWRECEN